MHPSSKTEMQNFINGYLDRGKELKIIEIGSRDPTSANTLDSTYRELFTNPGWTFHGMDLAPGNGVNIVSADPYHYPIESETYDVVVSGQVAEHVEDIFAWVKELKRITKTGGLVCIIAPCKWEYHPAPVDCWRFMRDGMRFLLSRTAGMDVLSVYERGNDCVGIARKKSEAVTLSVNVTEKMSNKDRF